MVELPSALMRAGIVEAGFLFLIMEWKKLVPLSTNINLLSFIFCYKNCLSASSRKLAVFLVSFTLFLRDMELGSFKSKFWATAKSSWALLTLSEIWENSYLFKVLKGNFRLFNFIHKQNCFVPWTGDCHFSLTKLVKPGCDIQRFRNLKGLSMLWIWGVKESMTEEWSDKVLNWRKFAWQSRNICDQLELVRTLSNLAQWCPLDQVKQFPIENASSIPREIVQDKNYSMSQLAILMPPCLSSIERVLLKSPSSIHGSSWLTPQEIKELQRSLLQTTVL